MLTPKRRISTKTIASNTFIATPMRVLAILQLCFAFTIILTRLSYPFMGELFTYKSNKLLYQYVMADSQSHLFAKLPATDRSEIVHHYQLLQEKADIPFLTKMVRAIHILVVELPLFERAWIVLAICISILLLLKRPGAIYASWLLPVVALAYCLNNFSMGIPAKPSPDAQLFPTEEMITAGYLDKPLSADIETQRLELLEGWKSYLIVNWLGEKPAEEKAAKVLQEARGEFAFNVARLQAIIQSPAQAHNPFSQKEPLILLVVYFSWNLFFAVYLYLVNNKRLQQINSNT